MRKFLAFFITAVLLLQSTAVFADDTKSSNVQISFRLGDSVLDINGTKVTVETPFAENGTTLVPLRVITEAFGADVFWNDETKQITLKYEDVTISLTIGDANAYVNGQKQPLLLAPRIVNSVTMVPLRFITETFGADVKWDDASGAILVTFSGAGTGPIDDISSALQQSNKAKIGDSHYKWSMDMPKSMVLTYQSFDGRSFEFESEDDNVYIYVDIYENDEKLTLDNIKANETKSAQYGTLVGQEIRTTKSGTTFVCTQSKNKYEFSDSKVYLKDGYIYEVYVSIDIDMPASDRQKYIDITDSFDFSFDKDTTDDLSNIVDGLRTFDNKNLNVEMNIPGDWQDRSNSNKENEFSFVQFDKDYNRLGHAVLRIYSVSNYKTAEEWAQAEYAFDKYTLNPKLVTFTAVAVTSIAGNQGYCYTYALKQADKDYVVRNTFFYYEGYAYMLTVKALKSEGDTIDKINASLKASKIDAAKVGKLAMPVHSIDNSVTTYENKYDKYKVSVPSDWYAYGSNSMFEDSVTGVSVQISVEKTTSINGSPQDLLDMLDEAEELGIKITSKSPSGKIKNEIIELTGSMTAYDETIYFQINVFTKGDMTFAVMSAIPEMYFTENVQNKLYKIANSIEIIK